MAAQEGPADHRIDDADAAAGPDQLAPDAEELDLRRHVPVRTTFGKRRFAHRGIWVEPSLLAEIEYRAKSAEGEVRRQP